MMIQFLVDLARKQQQEENLKSTSSTNQVTILTQHNQSNNKPNMVRSPSSTSSIDTWSILDDDWHDDKQCWSFKDDYVSFPSLEEEEEEQDDILSSIKHT
ncbi:hypothetical protein INT45_005511 [Circinella minor]|uniref:Uncharacterized protein n=1 Tax=Circinella minor TaxID=1195481 RepID=A0A8H7VGQ2_9FUNG|nr:hypothetical protein INT45_005511 [Circinella minor]